MKKAVGLKKEAMGAAASPVAEAKTVLSVGGYGSVGLKEVLFTSEGRMEQETDGWIGVVLTEKRPWYWPVVVRRHLREGFLIYLLICVPTFT